MPGRVGRLDLSVRAASADDRGLRPRAERFARDVLERFCEIMEERFPGREFVIRRLDLRYNLSPGQLAGPADAAFCASDLAETISAWFDLDEAPASLAVGADFRTASPSGSALRSAPSPGPDRSFVGKDKSGWARPEDRRSAREAVWPSADPAAAGDGLAGLDVGPGSEAFESAIERLVSLARQGAHANDAAWLSGVWSDLEGEGAPLRGMRRAIALAALSRLDASRGMIAVLADLAPAAVQALADALDADLRLLSRQWGEVRSRLLDLLEDEPDATPATKAARTDGGLSTLVRDFPPALSPEAAAIAVHVRSATSGLLAAPAGGPAEAAGAAAVATRARAPPPRSGQPAASAHREPGPAPERDATLQTRFGGLFYLLSLALELGVGETLWKVCLPEGQVLASAAAMILGEEAGFDAAPALFGGLPPGARPEPPPVSSEQQQEASREMLASLVAGLARFGVGSPSEPVLDLVDPPAGAMLIAHAGFPAPIFAWPAADPAALAAGVDTFLGVWPPTLGAPSASDVVRQVAGSRNLTRAEGAPGGPACFLPDSGSGAEAGALMAQLCGALLHLFHSRLVAFGGEPVTDCAALVSRHMSLPGRIALGPESLTVRLPMNRIEIDLRRAGLDRDPGWAPWMRRTVRIEFEPIDPGDET